jgi:hypothetical protein
VSSLRVELEKMAPVVGGNVCHVCDALPSLSDDDRVTLLEALQSRAFHATMIAKALDNIGQPVSIGSIRRHRRGECVAGKLT